jgi:hypothetical protein
MHQFSQASDFIAFEFEFKNTYKREERHRDVVLIKCLDRKKSKHHYHVQRKTAFAEFVWRRVHKTFMSKLPIAAKIIQMLDLFRDFSGNPSRSLSFAIVRSSCVANWARVAFARAQRALVDRFAAALCGGLPAV